MAARHSSRPLERRRFGDGGAILLLSVSAIMARRLVAAVTAAARPVLAAIRRLAGRPAGESPPSEPVTSDAD